MRLQASSAALSSFLLARFCAAQIPDVSQSLQNILKNTHNSKLYTYPTDLTRGIVPVSPPLHHRRALSHDMAETIPFAQ